MKRYFANTVHVVAISLFAATSGLAQQPVFGIRVVDEKVFADLPVATLSQHLAQLTQAAGIQLTLSHNLTLENELYANGASLYRVVDNLLPESYGFAFELDQNKEIRRLIVFSSDHSTNQPGPANERQRYLLRQAGRRDDATANIMRDTLSDRGLQDTQAKLIAIEQLADIEGTFAQESLQAGLGDSDPQVRLSTARTLYRLQGDDVVTLVGQVYYAEESASIRQALARMVRQSSHPLAQGIVRHSGLKMQAQRVSVP